ncbi:TadE/TadG family type IV pilus assembly protein [Bosea minatitlanensis]|uniref:TadE/TadG family type IV pilus assembly protein n=1 Tax=Bosea minatitlanensis TaxID=128782 RepID=A0ABW0F5U6_9HYPH|nr:TadE/TadG family type IV pilus assembly protein [Bosea minatitlanensis]MCT4494732.1 pilus assembly protein [Bosea minatitlanensis]
MIARLRLAGRRPWKRLRSDERGVAAIEFAFVLPVMLLVLCGMANTVYGVMAARKVRLLTSTLADLTARAQSVSPSDVTDIFGAAEAVLMPYDATKAAMVITSVVIEANGVARVCWSAASSSGAALKRGDSVVLPDSIKVPGTSVIMARASYDYRPFVASLPMVDYVVPAVIKLGDEPVYTRPRGGIAAGTGNIEQVLKTDVNPCPNY